MSKQPVNPETTVMNEAPKDTAATKNAARVESYDIAKSDEGGHENVRLPKLAVVMPGGLTVTE